MEKKEKILSVISIKGFRELKASDGMIKAKHDTLCLTREGFEALVLPPFQRPLRVNAKVKGIAVEMQGNGGVVSGYLTIGILNGIRYLVDGQHRREAFLLSCLRECYADVRLIEFDSMAEMAQEFVRLNSAIVKLRPDDILRGLESSVKGLEIIRELCPYIGYDQIRRSTASPVISMSMALRTWEATVNEIPSASGKSGAANLAGDLSEEKARAMCRFFNIAHNAWGRDKEYWRLWGSLNLTLCGWMWNNMVVHQYSVKSTRFTTEQFTSALTAVSASTRYLDWLVSRENNDHNRNPCYQRLKAIFAERLQRDMGKRIYFPHPAWVIN